VPQGCLFQTNITEIKGPGQSLEKCAYVCRKETTFRQVSPK